MFTPEELSIIQAAVETYNDEDRGVLTPEVQNSVSTSCLVKLEHYDSFTRFTKQEYTLFALALGHIIDIEEALPSRARDKQLLKNLKILFNRVCTLAR